MAAFLSKTYASAGNRRTFTISTWLKITNLSNSQSIFYGDTAGNTNGTNDDFYYANNKIYFGGYNSTYIVSTALFRDVSAWYHIVLSVDTTQATSANRIKLYVNGVEQARTEGAGYPAQNFETAFIKSGAFQICGNSPASGYGLHNLANFYYVDGTALNATSFGETDATTGIWKPKSYSGSYGTNGFFLKFENSGSLGTDSSGNGNNWTVNGTLTQTLDTPSNVFATFNPLMNNPANNATLTDGSLTVLSVTGTFSVTPATLAVGSGKWYYEVKCISGTLGDRTAKVGWGNPDKGVSMETQGSILYRNNTGNKVIDNTSTSYGATWTDGDIIGVALDISGGIVTFYKNGTTQGNITISGGLDDGTFYIPLVDVGNTDKLSVNFGNGVFGTTAISSPFSDGAGLGKFQYQPPTGYYALCTKNINVYG